MASVNAVPKVDAVPQGNAAEVLDEIRSLCKTMKSRSSQRRPRFPFHCKNGPLCPFLACHSCWFVHEGDEVPTICKAMESGTKKTENSIAQAKPHEPQVDFTMWMRSLEAKMDDKIQKLQADMRKLSSARQESQKLEAKLHDISSLELRLVSLGADMSENVDAKIEQIGDAEERLAHFEKNVEKRLRADITTDVDEKLSAFMKEAAVDEKLAEFMRTTVKRAFEDALNVGMNAFAEHVGARIQNIEDKLGIAEDSVGSGLVEKT